MEGSDLISDWRQVHVKSDTIHSGLLSWDLTKTVSQFEKAAYKNSRVNLRWATNGGHLDQLPGV